MSRHVCSADVIVCSLQWKQTSNPLFMLIRETALFLCSTNEPNKRTGRRGNWLHSRHHNNSYKHTHTYYSVRNAHSHIQLTACHPLMTDSSDSALLHGGCVDVSTRLTHQKCDLPDTRRGVNNLANMYFVSFMGNSFRALWCNLLSLWHLMVFFCLISIKSNLIQWCQTKRYGNFQEYIL